MYPSVYKKGSLSKFVLFILIYTCAAQAMTENYHRFVRQETEAVTEAAPPDAKPTARPKIPQPEEYLVDIREETKSICMGAYVKGFKNFNIVTTASCVMNVKRSLLRVYLREGKHTQHIENVQELLVHPRYTENKLAYNMALLKLEKKFGPYARPGAIGKAKKIYNKCSLYYFSSGRLDQEKAKMVTCPKSDKIVGSYGCLKGAGAKCLKDLNFIAVCEGKLSGIVVEEASCKFDNTYVTYDFPSFESFIRTGKEPPELMMESVDTETGTEGSEDSSGAIVFRGDRFACFILLYCMLHIY